MQSTSKKIMILLALIISIILLMPWLKGLVGVWVDGMSYIIYNTKEYSDSKGHILEGEFLVTIDLSNLESNIGEELYNDGKHKIYVDYIENRGSLKNGDYIIVFRSCGQYSLNGATLISGIRHGTKENFITKSITAEMTAQYNDRIYKCEAAGLSASNYKDGDSFLFFIFPSESYQNGEISLREEGKVKLIVTNLYKNIWSKK